MHRKFHEAWKRGFWDIRADKQTAIQTLLGRSRSNEKEQQSKTVEARWCTKNIFQRTVVIVSGGADVQNYLITAGEYE